MQEEKISLIVPVYNAEEYLSKCIDSILMQTHRNLELILIDDGSKDASGDICNKYNILDERIIVIHQENQGVSHARNTGLKLVTGKYICFIDADDWLEVNYLEEMYKIISQQTNRSIVICGCVEEYYRGSVFLNSGIYKPKKEGDIEDKLVRQNVHLYLEDWRPELWNKMFSKAILENELFDTNLSLGEDIEFLIRIYAKSTHFLIINQALYHFRIDVEREKKYQKTPFIEEVFREQQIEKGLIQWGGLPESIEMYMSSRILLIAYTSCYYVVRNGENVDECLRGILNNRYLKKRIGKKVYGNYKKTQRIMKILVYINSIWLCKQFFRVVLMKRRLKHG